jgi:glycosyltransferase involved in cell wall biosynthesis
LLVTKFFFVIISSIKLLKEKEVNLNNIKNFIKNTKIILAIPCLNEEKTIAKVIADFRAELPEIIIWVFDNGSSDNSFTIAAEKADKVFKVKKKGKGFVVQRIFEEFDGDILVMVDGDDTYSAQNLPQLLIPAFEDNADMVVGNRLHKDNKTAFKNSHFLGNYFFILLLNIFFKQNLKDILSGFRVFTKNFVKKVPLVSKGFEIETELTLQALGRNLTIEEVPVSLQKRPQGSFSKISTYRDGYQILLTIISILRDQKPLTFFGCIALFPLISGLILLFIYIKFLIDWILILGSSLIIIGIIFISTGLILNTINTRFNEIKGLFLRK